MNPQKPLTDREIEDLLRQDLEVAPPADLLDRLVADIPGGVVDLPTPVEKNQKTRPETPLRFWRRPWLIAATLLTTLGGAFVGYRTFQATYRPLEGLATFEEAAQESPSPVEQDGTVEQLGSSAPTGAPSPTTAAPDDARARALDKEVKDLSAKQPGQKLGEKKNDGGRADSFHALSSAISVPEPAAPAELGGLSAESGAESERILGGARIAELQSQLEQAKRESAAPVPASPPPPAALSAPKPALKRAAGDVTTTTAETEFADAPLRVGANAPPGAASGPGANGEPYRDVYYDDAGTQPFVDTEDDRLSTFGLDVDTGSYTIARRYLNDGNLPAKEGVRVEEFVNYFDYRDPAPRDGSDFALYAEGAPSPFGEGERYYLLRLALKGREVDARERPPATLTFVVDVSGSMDQENRLGLVKQSLGLLLDQLRPADQVALVVYGDRGRILLEPTSDKERMRRAIAELVPGGSTNANEGLVLGYELATRHRRPKTIHRLILCSDGVANVGATSAAAILDQVKHHARQGIELTTVGFGMGNYNDELMEKLADKGNGRYAYVDTLDEARRIFVESLTGTLQTLAAEARAQVEFDSGLVARWRLLGYENRDIADERFRDDTIDAGEIGVGHAVTAIYELKLSRPPRASDRLGRLTLRYASIAQGKMVEQEKVIRGADLRERWQDGSRAFRLASVVAEFAEILKGSFWAKKGDLSSLLPKVSRLVNDYEGDREVAELETLVRRAIQLKE